MSYHSPSCTRKRPSNNFNRNGNNLSSPCKSIKINNTIDLKYFNFLKENIPILRNDTLWNYVMDYVNVINNIKHSSVQKCIENINKTLEDMHNNAVSYNTNQMNNLKNGIVFKKKIENNIKILKKHNLTAVGLIEGIIQLTLHYYDKDVTLLSTLKKKKSKLWQVMLFSENKTLGEIIFEIYKSNSNNFDKNNKCLMIFKEIAKKLNDLQEKCGFIHGDFHSGNILINENPKLIQFIDFGYSYICLPGTNLTIFVPIQDNLNGSLSKISNNNNSKSADLFRLIESFNNDETHVFKDLIKQISERYFRNFNKSIYTRQPKKNLNGFKGLPIPFSRSSYFLNKKASNISESSFRYVSPDEFLEFTLDSNSLLHHPLDNSFLKKNNRNTTQIKSSFNSIKSIKSSLFENENENENDNI